MGFGPVEVTSNLKENNGDYIVRRKVYLARVRERIGRELESKLRYLERRLFEGVL